MRKIVLLALALAGCAAQQRRPEPEIRTVEVKVATPVPCKALEALGAEPAYADTDAAIAEASAIKDAGERIAALARLYAKGRLQRIQRLKEYAVAKTSCLF